MTYYLVDKVVNMLPTALLGVSIDGKSASNLCLVFLLVVNMLATALFGVSVGGKYVSISFVWCFDWW